MDPELYGYSEKAAKEAVSQVLTVDIRVTADNGRTGEKEKTERVRFTRNSSKININRKDRKGPVYSQFFKNQHK